MNGLKRLSVTAKQIDATLLRADQLERGEFLLNFRDRMNRGLFEQAGTLATIAFKRGNITKDEGLACLDEVKKAQEVQHKRLAN